MASQPRPTSVAEVVDDLARQGYTENFEVVDNRLRAVTTGKTFTPDEVAIREYHRFEGVSDPDDMAIVYAIESRDGTRGTLVDAFGVYSSPTISAFVKDLPIRPTERQAKATP